MDRNWTAERGHGTLFLKCRQPLRRGRKARCKMAVRRGKAATADMRENDNSVPTGAAYPQAPPAAAGPAPVAATWDPKNQPKVDRPGVCAEVCARGVDSGRWERRWLE